MGIGLEIDMGMGLQSITSHASVLHNPRVSYRPVIGGGGRGWCAHAGILGLLTFFASSRPLL